MISLFSSLRSIILSPLIHGYTMIYHDIQFSAVKNYGIIIFHGSFHGGLVGTSELRGSD